MAPGGKNPSLLFSLYPPTPRLEIFLYILESDSGRGSRVVDLFFNFSYITFFDAILLPLKRNSIGRLNYTFLFGKDQFSPSSCFLSDALLADMP